ncbi:hypothetical protein OPQ81_003298 [Rhizoctonia solani]|nr:hypothetical protein OPQ81_003298 [Rhizoctonia solani]
MVGFTLPPSCTRPLGGVLVSCTKKHSRGRRRVSLLRTATLVPSICASRPMKAIWKLERLTLIGLVENVGVQGRQLQQYRDRKAAILSRLQAIGEQLAANLAPFKDLPSLDGPGRPFTQAEIDAGPNKATALQALQEIRRLLFPGGQTLDDKIFDKAEETVQYLEDAEDEGLLDGMSVDEVQSMLEDAGI